jgi:hypothetical protein
MLAPARVEGIQTMRWQQGGRDHRIPAVFHAAWQSPDGRRAVALANWTSEAQSVAVVDERLGARVEMRTSAQTLELRVVQADRGVLTLSLPPLSCALVTSA